VIRRSGRLAGGFSQSNVLWTVNIRKGEGKSNANLYSESSRTPLTCSDMDHTVFPATTPYLSLPVSISQAAPQCNAHSKRLSSTYYSFIDPKRTNG